MNIYLISQNENNDYDTFDKAVVVTESEEQAKQIDPATVWAFNHISCFMNWTKYSYHWASSPANVAVKYIGVADPSYTEPTVICASFNAG